MPPLALIAGPTASGKSDLAVRLALALGDRGRRAVVINADSAQVYADLAVVSARPTEADMHGIEHRLFGDWDGAVACSAEDWAARARQTIAELHGSGAVPILVGGTGLYIRTLLDGIAPVPPIDPDIRAVVRSLSVEDAYTALQSEDPGAAGRLAPADTTRIARALEVVRSSGRPLSAWQTERSGGIGSCVALSPLVLLPPRPWLYERCDRRFAQMLHRGAVAEVEKLLDRQIEPAMPVMRAIGVPEIAAFIAGELDRAGLIDRGSQATRNYAKRQYTWFRGQVPAQWTRVDEIDFNLNDHFASLLHD